MTKTITKLKLACLALIGFTAGAQAQMFPACSVAIDSITYGANGLVNVYSTTTATPAWQNYTYCSMGNGASAGGNPVSYTYANNGTYTLNLTSFAYNPSDSTQNCTSNATATVTVTNATGNPGGGGGTCNLTANLTYTMIDSANYVFFGSNSGTGTPTSSYITVYTPTGSYINSPYDSLYLNMTSPGTYYLGYYLYDTLNGNCFDSTSLTVTIGGNPGGGTFNCSANFVLFQDSLNPTLWYAWNYANGSGALTYAWDFGDGSPVSTLAYPTHTYATAGTYAICLTITDATGCTSTSCDSTYKVIAGYNSVSSALQISVLSPVGVKEITNDLQNARLYPNPVNDKVTIEFTSKTALNATIQICNILGETVSSRTVAVNEGSNKLNVDFSEIQNGTYFVRIASANQSLKTFKIVK